MSRILGADPDHDWTRTLREVTKALPCPRCGAAASVTLVDGIGDGYGAAAYPVVAFRCVDNTHTLPVECAMRLWVDDRLSDYAGDCLTPHLR